jgi:NAD-dependent dihydropyrimidine dehydrogenase PreA subunit
MGRVLAYVILFRYYIAAAVLSVVIDSLFLRMIFVSRKALTIYCDCAYYDLADAEVKARVLAALKASGGDFVAVSDLCKLCADGDPRLKEWTNADSLRIFACYPRAVKWLFYRGGAPLPKDGVEFVNMRTGEIEEVLSSLNDGASGKREVSLEKDGDWVPWFPVIDYDRCKQCQQCFGFCLFGVYQLRDDETVEVSNPANCKTNCPACAKACPHSAIIFPKHGEGPINGDEVAETKSGDEGRAELADVLEGDIYDIIRKRGQRFSAEADKGASMTKQLQEKLGIPADVLASLSPAEMAGLLKDSNGKIGKAEDGEGEKSESEGDE